MNDAFLAEILRASNGMRSGDPAGATAIIQAALGAAGLTNGLTGSSGGLHPRMPLGPDTLTIEGSARVDGLDAPEAKVFSSQRLRKPLGEVLRTLSAGREGLGLTGMTSGLGSLPTARAPHLPLPPGAEFRDLTFSCAAGSRRYRLYVPASAREGARGLVVMLHGCTQNPEDFAAGTRMNDQAEKHELLVAYPAQTGGDNSMSCWNWFRPGDQTRDGGEPAILAGLTKSLRDEYAVPPDRIFVAGLSAGGAMAAILGETYPELYAAIGVHSGLAHGSANDVMSAFSAMKGQGGTVAPPTRRDAATPSPRVIVFHGGADTTVHPDNADRIIVGHGGHPATMEHFDHAPSAELRGYARRISKRDDGTNRLELWTIHGAQHAWSGGHASGSYTDPRGPDASAEMVRFFLGDRVANA